MNAQDTKAVAELAVRLRNAGVYGIVRVADLARRLVLLRNACHQHAELECNEKWYQPHAERKERLLSGRLRNIVAEINEHVGRPVVAETAIEGDPRGACLKIRFVGEPGTLEQDTGALAV